MSSIITDPAIQYSFELDPFQKQAISAIHREEDVLVCAKTGSGKTLVGEYQIAYSLRKGRRIFYTTPIKSLSNQKFYDLKYQFPDASVGIMTGDIKFCPTAQIIVMTTEILRNLLYKKGTTTEHLGLTASLSLENLDAVIFDECHYINDKDRGHVWEETIILLPQDTKLIMLSATLDSPEAFADWISKLKQRPTNLIKTEYRIVPLTHSVLYRVGDASSLSLVSFFDKSEAFHDKAYADWLKHRANEKKGHDMFRQHVREQRRIGVEGTIDGKVHVNSFVHTMNETIEFLQKKEFVPALFFVLSRKSCEEYASKVSTTLLAPSEAAQVEHIMSFHLHRYKNLETLPQYHTLRDLLKKGVAFHHSGLVPLLKEIVELLFTKGFVKVLFCTETFAVGLNMPTKTVVFVGLTKYDEETEQMRLLRTDEYIQMAGRAGRRGKDTFGQVIYLPDRHPVSLEEMRMIVCGGRPAITSRMNFHYDFILKTLQSGSLRWLQIMEHSYWFRQRSQQIISAEHMLQAIAEKLAHMSVQISQTEIDELEKYDKIEQLGGRSKEAQRAIERWKNAHMDPRWIVAKKIFTEWKSLQGAKVAAEKDIEDLKSHARGVDPIVEFLGKAGYILPCADTATSLTKEHLTLRGILATEVNEGHPILMTELFLKEWGHALSGAELATFLACFIRDSDKGDMPSVDALSVPDTVKHLLCKVDELARHYIQMEDTCGVVISTSLTANFWNLSTQWIEPIHRWLQGENAAAICKDMGIFEGNLVKAIMKVANLLDEWLSLATYCEHIAQIEKIMEVRRSLVRDIVVADSLYLHI